VWSSPNIEYVKELLLATNSPQNLLLFIGIEILFWIVISYLLILFIPKKFKAHKREIFLFFIVINVGFLFIGVILTLIMIFFALTWATQKESHPNYEMVDFEEYISEFPMVYSKFQEGLLIAEGKQSRKISVDEKIKSLSILYESNAQNNIDKVKNFLSDSSDETRLYAFALISSFEKKLNNQIKSLQAKIDSSKIKEEREEHLFELATTYWQFIYHGVASDKLSGFYTQKIANTLQEIPNHARAMVLMGKIKLFNREYKEAEEAFFKAIEMGIPKEAIGTFLAEIRFEQKRYNEVSQHINQEQFEIDVRLKPIGKMWVNK